MSGGIRVSSIYAKTLEARGHDVFLVSLPPKSLSLRQKLKAILKGQGLSPSLHSASYFDNSDLNLHILDCHRPPSNADIPDADVVIATWWETSEWVNALSDSKGAKVYFIQHHEVHSHLPIARCRATYTLPLHKIVIAKWLENVMRTEYGDTVVDLVPNSVDHSQFFAVQREKQPVPTIGFLYAPVEFKGVNITLKAIELLYQRFPRLRVIAFGSESPEGVFDFDSRIEFNYLPDQNFIKNLYAQCDVWVTASRTEGCNLTAMEAMACRTPVVSTKAGWPEEAIVNGANGFLVDVDDFQSLSNSVAAVILSSDEVWRGMSENAFDTVKDSSWQESTDLLEKALQHACQRAKDGQI
jgi:glycosyltransferase involved in cell wall biosynthesis